jgi:hypothetical protein
MLASLRVVWTFAARHDPSCRSVGTEPAWAGCFIKAVMTVRTTAGTEERAVGANKRRAQAPGGRAHRPEGNDHERDRDVEEVR